MSKITTADKLRSQIKAIRFERPDFISMVFAINGACWHHYPNEALYDLMEAHPFLFPDFIRPKGDMNITFTGPSKAGRPYRDDFGCIWETTDDGIIGTVTGHPLADWSSFDSWKVPDPEQSCGIGPIDWDAEKARIQAAHARNEPAGGSLRHGHTFLQLCDIRGYQNLIYDMMDEEPRLTELIGRLEEFNTALVQHYLWLGVDTFGFPEDLGMQVGPMLSPDNFRQYIKPSYQRMMKLVRDAGVPVHMHSDGDIRVLVDDLIEGGVECINLQDLINGIDWIADQFRGRIAVDLDLDRQKITPFGTPEEINRLVREEVEKISTPQGGMSMIYGLYPGVPLENVKAVMDAMERYAFYYD